MGGREIKSTSKDHDFTTFMEKQNTIEPNKHRTHDQKLHVSRIVILFLR